MERDIAGVCVWRGGGLLNWMERSAGVSHMEKGRAFLDGVQYGLRVCIPGGERGPSPARAVEDFELAQGPLLMLQVSSLPLGTPL